PASEPRLSTPRPIVSCSGRPSAESPTSSPCGSKLSSAHLSTGGMFGGPEPSRRRSSPGLPETMKCEHAPTCLSLQGRNAEPPVTFRATGRKGVRETPHLGNLCEEVLPFSP